MNFREKAIFIWNDEVIGDAQYIARQLIDAGFQAAYLHYQTLSGWRSPSRIALAAALKVAGLVVYGAAAVYGADPKKEGQQAAQIVEDYNLDGFIFDAESSFDAKPTPDSNAVHMLTAYKAITSKPAAWCWWPFYKSPKTGGGWHPVNVLRAAMDYADVGIPMAYWWMGDSPAQAVDFLEKTWSQWREVTDKPIIPAGRAYVGDQGTAKPDAVLAYEERARELGAAGITWWSMEHAVKLPGVWEALAATPGYDQGSEDKEMFEDKALSLYIKSDYKVTDWDALAASVDGAVFIRAAYVPLSSFADPASGKTIQIPNYDTAKTDDDMLREDPDYRPNRAKAKAKGLRVVAVIEYCPFYDKDSNFNGKNQLNQIKRILTGLDDAKGDAVCMQIMYNQWVENSKITTIPDSNFKKGVSLLFEDLYEAFHQTVYGWSQASLLKYNAGGYNYLREFTTWLDTANAGEPTWPFGFTYLPAAWKQVWKTNVQTLREAVNLAPALTTSEADTNLRIGSFTGWSMKNEAGNMYNHGFYALFGTYMPFLKNAAGAPVMAEPIIIDTDKTSWFLWMGWALGPELDTIPPSAPAGLIAAVSGQDVTLSWSPSTDNVGVTGYGIWRNGSYLTGVGGTTFSDSSMPPGAYNYEVDAYDAAGNHSPRALVSVVIGTPGGGGEVSRVEFEAALARLAELERWRRS